MSREGNRKNLAEKLGFRTDLKIFNITNRIKAFRLGWTYDKTRKMYINSENIAVMDRYYNLL